MIVDKAPQRPSLDPRDPDALIPASICPTCGHRPHPDATIPMWRGGIVTDAATLERLGLTHWLVYWWDEDLRPREGPCLQPAVGTRTLSERHGKKLYAAEFGVRVLDLTPAILAAIESSLA